MREDDNSAMSYLKKSLSFIPGLRLLLLIVLTIVLIFIYFPITRPPILSYAPQKIYLPPVSPSPQPRIESMTTFDIDGEQYDIYITPERMLFQPFGDGASRFTSFAITREAYPKLFGTALYQEYFINVRVLKDKKSSLVEITNNRHNHGGYDVTYKVVVNPITGEVSVLE